MRNKIIQSNTRKILETALAECYVNALTKRTKFGMRLRNWSEISQLVECSVENKIYINTLCSFSRLLRLVVHIWLLLEKREERQRKQKWEEKRTESRKEAMTIRTTSKWARSNWHYEKTQSFIIRLNISHVSMEFANAKRYWCRFLPILCKLFENMVEGHPMRRTEKKSLTQK